MNQADLGPKDLGSQGEVEHQQKETAEERLPMTTISSPVSAKAEPEKPKRGFFSKIAKAPTKLWNKLTTLTDKQSKKSPIASAILTEPGNTCEFLSNF